MEENKVLEVDVVEPQEGRDITEETKNNGFKNIFTQQSFNTEREAVDSYDALNKGFIIIDDIRSDFGRLSNPNEIATLQIELKKLMPDIDLEIDGRMDLKTERALREYEKLLGLM